MATDLKTDELFSLLESGQLQSSNLVKHDFINLRNAVYTLYILISDHIYTLRVIMRMSMSLTGKSNFFLIRKY